MERDREKGNNDAEIKKGKAQVKEKEPDCYTRGRRVPVVEEAARLFHVTTLHKAASNKGILCTLMAAPPMTSQPHLSIGDR